jgi:excisionase family DNA binding protein
LLSEAYDLILRKHKGEAEHPMSSSAETLAFLHAHGLNVEPTALGASLRAAVASLKQGFYSEAGAEGLTAGELAVARQGGLEPSAQVGPDPMERAVVEHARLLETGLTTSGAAERLGVTDARIRQRIEGRSLMAMRRGRTWRLPLFQFIGAGEVPGWSTVCRRLSVDASPVAVERWMLLPHSDLVVGKSEERIAPLEWLHQGRLAARVAELASRLS